MFCFTRLYACTRFPLCSICSSKSLWPPREEGSIRAGEELCAPAYPGGFTAALCREPSFEVGCCRCSLRERIGFLSPLSSALPASGVPYRRTMASADSCRFSVTSRRRLPSYLAYLQASPDKNIVFPLMHPPKFTALALGGFGLCCVPATHPARTASNWVRVPRVKRLPPASFRFRLAANTLAFG